MNRPAEEPADDPLALDGKVAVVTGGGQGIGRRVAERFAASGVQVFVGDLDEGRAGTAASELSDEIGREVVGLGVDVSSEDSVSELARSATERSGRLDIWANFAATGYPTDPKKFFDVADSPWRCGTRCSRST
jgi:NAD(P)-dependent dehydrogenase (short-subunit alcohol dehydrogenase family)